VIAFSLIASVLGFAPSKASARGCEECPIPMAEWLGNWWNDASGLKLEIKRLPGTRQTVRVTLRDIDSNRIVADGIGMIPTESETLRMKLRRNDGVQFITSFTIDTELHRVRAYIPAWIGSTLNGQDLPPDLYFVD
jgi:hypothetical protein